jgi:DNA invertase Pin-like site-specific DNA recombinase
MQAKCAIYTRVSTDSQTEVEFNSCQAQEEKIKSFINSQENLLVFKVYNDAGFTGANLERPALQEMLRDLQENKINTVIVYKIDRLTRSPKDFYALMEIFEQYKVDFISITERFDTSSPAGRLLALRVKPWICRSLRSLPIGVLVPRVSALRFGIES